MNPFDAPFDEHAFEKDVPNNDFSKEEPDLSTQLNNEGVLFEYQQWLEELAMARGNGRSLDRDWEYDYER